MKIVNQKGEKVFEVGNQKIGGKNFTLIAGPCAVEGTEQILETAIGLDKLGIKFLRGSIQAKDIALLFPGHGRGRAELSCPGKGKDRNACCN